MRVGQVGWDLRDNGHGHVAFALIRNVRHGGYGRGRVLGSGLAGLYWTQSVVCEDNSLRGLLVHDHRARRVANNGNATKLNEGEGTFYSSMVGTIADLACIGLLGNPTWLEVEEGGGRRDRTMGMIKLGGPGPVSGGGVQSKSATILGNDICLSDA